MTSRGRSLRSTLSWATLVLAGLALAAAVAVVAVTTLLHRASGAIEASTRSIWVAEEAQIDLLLHARATSLLTRRDLAGSVQGRLAEAELYVGNERERALLDEAKARALEYVLASRDAGRSEAEVAALHAAAFAALEDLTTINVSQAREEARRTARVDYLANIGGLTLALLILGVAAFFILWVRGPLIRPIRELGQAMRKFGRGEQTIRARTAGPREVREMAERFNEMATAIERQRERQRAFLAGVAHDLRNPVNAVFLSTEAARLDASLPPDHRVRRVLDRSTRQLRKLDRMISDFLDAAAIETGELELRLELCDVTEVVRSTAEFFEEGSPRHDVVLSFSSEPLRAQIDSLRIEQVVSNLISNAIKYSPEGGNVEVRLDQLGDELLIEVTDHGLGMSRDTQSHLFEPFRRGLSREDIPGVGLGLFVVRRIVEAHHGRIEVESAPGAGSTFCVFLPSLSAGAAGRKDSKQDAEEGMYVRGR